MHEILYKNKKFCTNGIIMSKNFQVYTAKNAQVAANLLTSCNNLLQVYIRCVHMACDKLVDYEPVTCCQQFCYKSIVETCYPQVCCKFFQQVVTSLQMITCNKRVKLTTCNMSNAFLAVYLCSSESLIRSSQCHELSTSKFFQRVIIIFCAVQAELVPLGFR